ncbi:hypothetical protein SORBI_3008G147250 [Sorghum bicolor]|uniref:Uncharacterized protein n=1 Tax=Sorghum bicolor TaxID=4558 RepID=A0A1Z5R7M8_SORBI|nr:hypothetical protein SORBI_3008G147250 [Sorghum bicolor]
METSRVPLNWNIHRSLSPGPPALLLLPPTIPTRVVTLPTTTAVSQQLPFLSLLPSSSRRSHHSAVSVCTPLLGSREPTPIATPAPTERASQPATKSAVLPPARARLIGA